MDNRNEMSGLGHARAAAFAFFATVWAVLLSIGTFLYNHWRGTMATVATAALAFGVYTGVTAFQEWRNSANQVASSGHVETVQLAKARQASPIEFVAHTVRRGDDLTIIADQHGVPLEDVIRFNRGMLVEQYVDVCGSLSDRYRNRRGGLFCNDRYNRPFANTLMPDTVVRIPKLGARAPVAIARAIAQTPGKRIALVIDDTGSMKDDRERVITWMQDEIVAQDKEVVGVFLFADGKTFHINASGDEIVDELRSEGDVENAYSALLAASANTDADSLALIGDEPGDDWPSTNFWGEELIIPVLATCIDSKNSHNASCETAFTKIAKDTGGAFVSVR